jgi:O-antigen/teichoic acid export membrane protein
MQIADTLTARTTRAARWRLGGAVVGAGLQFGVGVLLARLLAPADFGVVALAYVVLGLARPLCDVGIGDAIVQRQELTNRHVRTAATFSVLMGIAVAGVLVVLAPALASMMRDARVVPVLRVLSVALAIRSTAIVSDAMLRRQLEFRPQVVIETGSYVVGYGCVAVGLALFGYGVWSLVWGALAETLLSSIAQITIVRHDFRPMLVRQELDQLLGFGAGATMSAWANYVALNGDYFVVGRSLGAARLGLYVRAYTLMKLPHTYVASALSRVMFPAFASVQTEPLRLRRGYLLLTEVVAIVAAPSMAVLAVVAPHFLRGVYGPQWIGAVVPLQVLCLGGYLRSLYHPSAIVAQSVGQVYQELWREVIYAGLVIAGAAIGSRYGLAGVAMGVSAAIVYMFAACGHLALRATGATWAEYFRAQRSGLFAAVVAGGVALSTRLLLEASGAPSGAIALAVLAAAAVPWTASLARLLARPDCEPLREWLPTWGARFVQTLSQSRAIGQEP